MANSPKAKRRATLPACLTYSVVLATFIVPLAGSSALAADAYKCVAQDGSTTYTDSPCDPAARSQQMMAPPLAPAPPARTVPNSLSPQALAAARQQSRLESTALSCSTERYNLWIKVQGQSLPDPQIRKAKLIEISNACRRPLGLPDMVDKTPKTGALPPLMGPAGAAAAATLKELVTSGFIERLQKYLSSPGVNIDDRPGTDEALLDYAAEQNQVAITRYLLEHGASPNAYQTKGLDRGLTALHRAAAADAAEVTELLLARGAQVNVHGPLGTTPLIVAASNGSRRAAQVLLDHGADIAVSNGHNETALSVASAHGHDDIVQMIL